MLILECFFRRDLEHCPNFDKLKTLTLNEWFTAYLEKLILQLDNTKNFVGATGSKQSFVCAPTLAVNIECGKVDNGVRKLLKVLSTRGILGEQISIKCCSCTQILPSTDWN